MVKRDPGIYGDFRRPSRPRRVRDRCPECSYAIEWGDIHADAGEGTERRWVCAVASCEHCGLELRWDPNQTHLLADRRADASAKWEAEQRTEQANLLEDG